MRTSSDNPTRRTVPMLHPRKLTALMKKSVIYILILACLLLASCGSTMPADPGTTSVVQMTTDSTGGSSASAKMMRWAFFTDEALRSLSCLFQSGEERDKAVLRIQNYLDSLE